MKIRFDKVLMRLRAVILAMALLLPVATSNITVKAAEATEIPMQAIGIDVSRFQGLIDWDSVAASGVSFAMIRIGSRPYDTGIIVEDVYARYNLQEANRVGIKVGVYFNSTAISEAEVIEEANFTINFISKYNITFPVAYDCEGYNSASHRQYGLGKDVRTALAVKFLDTVAAAGYTPMFYSSKYAMTSSKEWNMDLLNKYKVWVAQYPSQPYPLTPATTYEGTYAMWQCSETGTINGISGAVDLDIAYFYYDGVNDAKDPVAPVTLTAQTAANIIFTPVNEVVTVDKNDVNLRTLPSYEEASTIVAKLNQGDAMIRAGIGNNGWSQVIVNGQVYYVSTAYLTKVL